MITEEQNDNRKLLKEFYEVALNLNKMKQDAESELLLSKKTANRTHPVRPNRIGYRKHKTN